MTPADPSNVAAVFSRFPDCDAAVKPFEARRGASQ
jgi:hypothetical protein